MKDDLSSPSNVTKYSYKVYEDGPLTYYHYYFEETEPPRMPVDSSQSLANPKLLPAGLSATGMLTAAFVSGFAVVSVAHHQPAPTAPPIAKQQLPQKSGPKLSLAPAVRPEKLGVTPISLRPKSGQNPIQAPIQANVKPTLVPSVATPSVSGGDRSKTKVATSNHLTTGGSAIAAPETSTVRLKLSKAVKPIAGHTATVVAAAP
jgi:hypothetical protein